MIWIYWVLGLTFSTISGAMLVRKWKNLYGYSVLLAIYTSLIVFSNLLVNRLALIDLGFITVVSPSVVLVFPFTAQVIDMINEVYGRKATYRSIMITLISSVMVTFLTYHLMELKPALFAMNVPEVYEDAWRYLLSQVPRVVAVSYFAFFVGNMIDAKVFADLKKYFYTKYREAYRSNKAIITFVLIRSIVSDIINMLVDTSIFIPLTFLGVLPNDIVISMIGFQAITKIFVITITQPFFIGYRVLIKDVERQVD